MLEIQGKHGKKGTKKITGAIFDADGTLLDSMQMWGRIEIDFLISLGVTPRPGLREVLRSLGGHEVPEYFRIEYGVDMTIDEISAGINALIEESYFQKVPLKHGVVRVLDLFRDRGVRMCVASATDRYLIEAALRRCGIDEYFGRVFSCGDEGTSKSDTKIFYRAAAFLGTDVRNTLVVEDALYAMRTAKSAGFPVVAVFDASWGDRTEDIKDLCDHYFIKMDEMLDVII